MMAYALTARLSLRLYQPIKHNKQMTRMGMRDNNIILWQQVLSDHMRR